MRKFTVFLLLSLVLLTGLVPSRVHALDAPTHVRVLLSTGEARRVTVSLTGDYRVGTVPVSGGTITFEKRGDRIAIVHSEAGLLDENELVYLTRAGGDRFEAFFTLENSRYGRLSYQGDLMGCLDDDGTLLIINYVPFRDYLYGVTGSELRDVAYPEALKAEAVAAKGYVLSCMHTTKPYDVADTPRDQVYKGYRAGVSPVTEAVDAVFGETLTLNGKPIKCYYCTSNGGQTLTPAMRWGGGNSNDAYEMTYDPFDVAGSEHSAVLPVSRTCADWSAELYSFFLALVRQQQPDADALLSLEALAGYHHAEKLSGSPLLPDDRAPQALAEATLTISANGSERTLVCGFAPKSLAEQGVVDCKNADVYFIRDLGNAYEAVFGKSDGHRVGMSHCGMLEMARKGYSYRDILAFYYPNADLMRDNGLVDPVTLPEPTPYAIEVIETASVQQTSSWSSLLSDIF